jgi:mono/diheme cytochrome c family protein
LHSHGRAASQSPALRKRFDTLLFRVRVIAMRHTVAALFVIAAVSCTARAAAQNAAAFYEENCAACHTIGGGPQAGPDLKGVTIRRDREWLIRFLLDPAAFESDPQVVEMIKAADGLMMPPTDGLDRAMAEALLTLIEQRSGAGVRAPRAELSIQPGDVERGRALFTGASRLSGSGPACVACHDARLSGGRLAPDLASAPARLGGLAGLSAWLVATPTPVMHALYRASPIDAGESRALAAFLEEPAGDPAPGASPALRLLVLGLAGSVLVFVAAGVIWRRRFTAVRRPLVARAREALAHLPLPSASGSNRSGGLQ